MVSARTVAAADNLQTTLEKLDQAAANFKSASTDFEFDRTQTDPVPDTDVLKGTAYYERKGSNFQMAAHITTDNGKPAPRVYAFSGGVLRLNEPGINQVTTITKASKFAEYIMLGFGASGKELADKWTIADLGPETLNGVQTEKLELVAKDPNVKKNLPKVTIWMDLSRAVSVKQIFDEGQGQSRTCTYSNIRTNHSLPGDAFTFKTDKKTQYMNQ
jgi:outer membrane lipoprotein-sorting protein